MFHQIAEGRDGLVAGRFEAQLGQPLVDIAQGRIRGSFLGEAGRLLLGDNSLLDRHHNGVGVGRDRHAAQFVKLLLEEVPAGLPAFVLLVDDRFPLQVLEAHAGRLEEAAQVEPVNRVRKSIFLGGGKLDLEDQGVIGDLDAYRLADGRHRIIVPPEENRVFLIVLQIPAGRFDDVAVAIHRGSGTDELQDSVLGVADLPDLKI